MEKDEKFKVASDDWIETYPLMERIISTKEVLWINPRYALFDDAIKKTSIGPQHVTEAEDRLARFAPYIAKVFPETKPTNGLIESLLVRIPKMQHELENMFGQQTSGELFLKCDNDLPISGSVKARGGIYAVLKHAEDLAIQRNMLRLGDDYSVMEGNTFRDFFSQYTISVGSTGNLGLSIGMIGAKLGFRVTVHMSADAKQWKKDLLRSKGVTVVEYAADYNKAVEEGRKQSSTNPNSYFIDDENSKELFLGYAVAAYRLKRQLDDMHIMVDESHPLFVYLPCGVGGAPGGVSFGLKLIFQDNVHCFFAEPTHSPAMMVGLMTGLHDKVSVRDFGIDNVTDADGLAVGRPSGFVAKILENLVSGAYTLSDSKLYVLLTTLALSENIYLEPSALAGLPGIIRLFNDAPAQTYLEKHKLIGKMKDAAHIAWATGGSMVPKEIMQDYYEKGLGLLLARRV
ncbi:D-serine dehydratase [Peptococcaceae bacterium CEB3]|nr:D-serine dehydratase [Peptococcaceae bacterium CEB3]